MNRNMAAKALAVLMGICFLFPSAAQAQQDGSFAPHIPGHGSVSLVGMNGEMTTESLLTKDHSLGGAQTDCASLGIGPCAQDAPDAGISHVFAWSVLPLCNKQNSGYCVSSVNIYKSGENPKPASYIGQSEGNKFRAQPSYNLPEGGGALVFNAPGVPHSGGATTYAVVASYVSFCSGPSYKCVYNSFYLNVQPFTSNGRNQTSYIGAEKFDFSPGTRVGVTLQVPESVGGWFAGRLLDPTLTITPLKGEHGFIQMQVDAEALDVNRISASVPNDSYTPHMKALNIPPDGIVAIESGSDEAINFVEELRPFVSDKSTGRQSVWQLKAIFIQNSICYPTGQVNGLVTTNAVGYSWNPPVFSDGFLNYKMAGLHYNKDGTIAHGTYDLIMRSDVARCLYGFSNAPISASVQIIAADGTNENIATSVVAERDGWLKIAAYGFTFSSPTARVKIQVAKGTSSIGQTKQPRSTLVCQKGSKKVKISGMKPQCPKGWKKAAN